MTWERALVAGWKVGSSHFLRCRTVGSRYCLGWCDRLSTWAPRLSPPHPPVRLSRRQLLWGAMGAAANSRGTGSGPEALRATGPPGGGGGGGAPPPSVPQSRGGPRWGPLQRAPAVAWRRLRRPPPPRPPRGWCGACPCHPAGALAGATPHRPTCQAARGEHPLFRVELPSLVAPPGFGAVEQHRNDSMGPSKAGAREQEGVGGRRGDAPGGGAAAQEGGGALHVRPHLLIQRVHQRQVLPVHLPPPAAGRQSML